MPSLGVKIMNEMSFFCVLKVTFLFRFDCKVIHFSLSRKINHSRLTSFDSSTKDVCIYLNNASSILKRFLIGADITTVNAIAFFLLLLLLLSLLVCCFRLEQMWI